jgi:hypothetical protein
MRKAGNKTSREEAATIIGRIAKLGKTTVNLIDFVNFMTPLQNISQSRRLRTVSAHKYLQTFDNEYETLLKERMVPIHQRSTTVGHHNQYSERESINLKLY